MTRMARRDAIYRRDPLELTAFIGEAVLRDVIGGPDVMLDQLRHLTDVAKRHSVSLRVMPPGIGWHPGLLGPFVVYDFLDTPSVVHIEHHMSSAFLYENHLVEEFHKAAATMMDLALTEQQTTTLIATIIDEREADE